MFILILFGIITSLGTILLSMFIFQQAKQKQLAKKWQTRKAQSDAYLNEFRRQRKVVTIILKK